MILVISCINYILANDDGIEYLPFKCCENNGINDGNYGLRKRKKFDKFWHVHKKCNMNIKGNVLKLLLCNLFKRMFDCNPYERMAIFKFLGLVLFKIYIQQNLTCI